MSTKHVWIAMGMAGLLASEAWGQLPAQFIKTSQDGTPIPDVDKNPFPPAPGDNSCWLASAANILGAAGYGTGPAAQQRAQGIYNQLTAAYGVASGGAPDQAISYWMAWHGKNPNSPDYSPTLTYTDVTAEYRTLTQVDYAFLQSELYRCQYVGVQFDSPAHAVTLVGWNSNTGQSIWTDSDRDVGIGGNDSYNNSFTTQWDLVDPATLTTYLSRANGYVTFCPGLGKDPNFVANYDLAWAPSPTGPKAREAGIKAGQTYPPAPGWQQTWTDPTDPNITFAPFRVNNELVPEMEKHIQLLVDFHGRDANYINEDIRLRYLDQFGQEVIALPTSKTLSPDNGQVLFLWELASQPGWEEIFFPTYLEYGLLEGSVASWNVATLCVPEPASFSIFALVGLAMVRRHGQD